MKGILVLLALTFVAFFGGAGGLGGFTGGGGNVGGVGNLNSLVQVGDVDIDARTVTDAYNQQLRAFSQLLGSQISPDQARQLGLLDQTIQQLVSQALFDQTAAELGVSISDQSVAQAVRTLPQFQGANGGFDPNLFQATLSQAGIGEAEFVNSVRGNLARGQVLGTVQDAAIAPFTMVDAIYNYRQEQRIVETVRIGAIDLPNLSEPTQAQISAFYDGAKDQFLAPEYRQFSVASLSLEQLAEQLVVDEGELRIDYEIRENEFRTPELREITQAIFTDLEMPGMNGFELLTAIKNDPRTPNKPVVIVTSRDEPETKDKARELGADGFLSKPVSDATIEAILEDLVITPRT